MNLPPWRRIERDLGDEFDDPGFEYDHDKAQWLCRQQRPVDNIKIKIPPFRGTSSPEEYLEWVQRVEKIFKGQDHTKASKVKLATLEFTDYANLWWENVKA